MNRKQIIAEELKGLDKYDYNIPILEKMLNNTINRTAEGMYKAFLDFLIDEGITEEDEVEKLLELKKEWVDRYG